MPSSELLAKMLVEEAAKKGYLKGSKIALREIRRSTIKDLLGKVFKIRPEPAEEVPGLYRMHPPKMPIEPVSEEHARVMEGVLQPMAGVPVGSRPSEDRLKLVASILGNFRYERLAKYLATKPPEQAYKTYRRQGRGETLKEYLRSHTLDVDVSNLEEFVKIPVAQRGVLTAALRAEQAVGGPIGTSELMRTPVPEKTGRTQLFVSGPMHRGGWSPWDWSDRMLRHLNSLAKRGYLNKNKTSGRYKFSSTEKARNLIKTLGATSGLGLGLSESTLPPGGED